MWLSFHDRLLTTNNLANRSICFSSSCMLCEVHLETLAHILLHCPFTMDLWAPVRNRLAISSSPSFIANLWGDWRLATIPNNMVNYWNCVVNTIVWIVWHEWNQRVFKAKSSSINELGGRSKSLVGQAHFPLHKCPP